MKIHRRTGIPSQNAKIILAKIDRFMYLVILVPSIYVFSYFPLGFEGRMWDLIVSVPDHCLSFYFTICCMYSKETPR